MGFKSKYSGRQLEEKLDSIKNINVVDALDSEDGGAALSANQGRVLKKMIEELPSGGTGSSGDSIAVDSALSLESTNPVQNKVLTEALEGKTDFRYLYQGANEEEKAYNLETLRMLNAGFKGDVIMTMGEDGFAVVTTVSYSNDGQWRFILIELLLLGGLTTYYYIDETGVLQIYFDESAIQGTLYNTVMFPFPLNNDHRKVIVDKLINTNTIQAQMYTIAKLKGHNNGSIYFAWEAVFDDDMNALGVYAYYYDNGICIDCINLDGSIASKIQLPIRVGNPSVYNVQNDLGYRFLKWGDRNVIVKVDSTAEYHPISIKQVEEYDSSKGYLITILRDLKLETYLFLPDGSFTLNSETDLKV